jgi:predicted RNA binding protein YcfA (HicA-like mRNA interferase family)
MPKVTYRQVARLLAELGFKEEHTQGTHHLYVHPVAHAQIMMPDAPGEDVVLPSVWSGIRRTISEFGIMEPGDVDERIFLPAY